MSWNLTIFLPACLMKFRPPDGSSRQPDGEMKRCPRSSSTEIDHSFIPLASRWSANYDLDITPQRGLERFLELRQSSETWDEVASKHSASFTVEFHAIVSQLFSLFFPILYGLIGPVGWLLHSLWRAGSWAESFQRRFMSDWVSPVSDLGSAVQLRLKPEEASSSCWGGAELVAVQPVSGHVVIAVEFFKKSIRL